MGKDISKSFLVEKSEHRLVPYYSRVIFGNFIVQIELVKLITRRVLSNKWDFTIKVRWLQPVRTKVAFGLALARRLKFRRIDSVATNFTALRSELRVTYAGTFLSSFEWEPGKKALKGINIEQTTFR